MMEQIMKVPLCLRALAKDRSTLKYTLSFIDNLVSLSQFTDHFEFNWKDTALPLLYQTADYPKELCVESTNKTGQRKVEGILETEVYDAWL